MRWAVISACSTAAALGIVISLGAQAPAPTSGTWTVKVIGCLGKDKEQYSLVGATVDPAGAESAPDSVKTARRFRVEGNGLDRLDRYVGDQVEVTGTATAPPP